MPQSKPTPVRRSARVAAGGETVTTTAQPQGPDVQQLVEDNRELESEIARRVALLQQPCEQEQYGSDQQQGADALQSRRYSCNINNS